MSLLSDKSKSLVGIDVGPSAIKVVDLAKTAHGYRLERCARGAVPSGLVDGRRIIQPKALGEALKETLKAGGFKARHAAVAVASSSVITKVLTMPSGMEDRELEAMVQLEADQYVPYALDEVKIDFEVLGPSRAAPDSVDVMLAASHSENVDELVTAVRAAGVEPQLVDVESFALQNACEALSGRWPQGEAASALALVDIGAFSTSVIVIQNGHLVYARDQNIGGSRLTDDIAALYELEPGQAERMKITGDLHDERAQNVEALFAQSLAQEIRSALQFYYSAGAGEEVSQVFVAGGAAVGPGLIPAMAAAGLSAEVFNPFEGMEIAPRMKSADILASAPAYAVACGLALRGLAS